MFSNLLFLVLVLLLINFSQEIDPSTWSYPSLSSFWEGLALYAGFLGIIFLQIYLFRNKKVSKNLLLLITQLELLLFLLIYHFLLGGHRIFGAWNTLSTVFSLGLYLSAIGFFHFVYSSLHYAKKPLTAVQQEIRLILPFALPFLLFTFLFNILLTIPNENVQSYLTPSTLFIASLVFMVFMLFFLPPLIVTLWQCTPIEDSPLKRRLDQLCANAHFRHGGMLYWSIIDQSLTAAIVGVLPRFRYVMFTKRLLQQLSPDAVEAILAHEIGHSYRRHLLIYPLILFGMIASASIVSLLFSETITTWFQQHEDLLLLYPVVLFIMYASVIALYFRYVFGYFSRLFERQADLHGFTLNLSADHMIEALNDVAIATGFTHFVPNWHHYSIQQRMDFLRAAKEHPYLIEQHHRKVRCAVCCYIIILIPLLILMLASFYPDTAWLHAIEDGLTSISHRISAFVNSI